MFKFFKEKISGVKEESKKQEEPSFELAPMVPGSTFDNLEIEKLNSNDLALLMINMLGFHVASFEDITADQIKGTDFESAFITGGRGRDVSLEAFLNQKGIYPEHTISFGNNIIVSPNYGEVLKKAYDNIHTTVSADPFSSLGSLFSKIKNAADGSSADTFLFSNSATNVQYSFPKRFAKGFYHLAKHLEVLHYNNTVDEMSEAQGKGPNPSLYKKISREKHSVSEYLSDFVRNQK